jgi:hypothetical protein
VKWDGAEMTFTQLVLRCAACADKGRKTEIGNVFQMSGQHPRAGQPPTVDARCNPRYADRPSGGRTLTVTCSRCHAEPQVAWDDVLAKFSSLRHDGVAMDRLTI